MASTSDHGHGLIGPSSKTLKPAVLGLDVGTTATRASLASFDCGPSKPPDIVLRPDSSEYQERYQAGDFPSAANLFAVDESPATCIGYVGDGPEQTPLKMYPYIARIRVMRARGRDSDRVLEDVYRRKIPQLYRFVRRFDNLIPKMQDRVMAHARRVFLAHLRLVRSRSETLAESRGYTITQVVATIPPNWDRWTQHFYIDLLKHTWNTLRSTDIMLLYESEAIGHWLLGMDQKTQKEKPKRLIMADFGGHTLSHNVFVINYRDKDPEEDDPEQFSFMTVSFDNCVHGGSELHASLVKERIQKEISRGKIVIRNKTEERKLYESFMDNYRKVRGKIDGSSFSIRGWTSDTGATASTITFSKDEAKRLYMKCFGRPLAQLYSVLRKNAKLGTDVAVVLNGGTFSNAHISRQTRKMIRDLGLKYLPWTDSIAVANRQSSMVAVGAAMAMIRSQSVEKFMAQAAFAVEVKNREQLYVPVIWNNSQSRDARISIGSKHGADVVITCCPLPPSRYDDMMPREKTFEFQPLSKKLKGDNTLSLNYIPEDSASGRPDKLILTVTRTNDTGQPVDVNTVEWPVYYDPGGCAVFVEIDGDDRLPSAAESNDSQETATRLRSRRRKSYFKLWEEYRCDPGKSYWEGIEYESLPMESLQQFVDGDAADLDDDNAMPIEISDDDSEPAVNSTPLEEIGHGSRAGGKRQRQPDKTGDDDAASQQNKRRKRDDAAASERRRGKPREEPAASAFARTSTFRETRSETAKDSDAEGECTGYSLEPMNGVTRNPRPSQWPRLVADSSPPEQTGPGHRDTAGQNVLTQNVTSQSRRSFLGTISRRQLPAGNGERGLSARRLTAAPQRRQVNSGRLGERAATGDAPSLVAMRPDLGRQVPTLARQSQSRAPYAQMH